MRSGTALRDLRRAVSWHRRLLAAGLAAAAVAFGLSALSPAPAPTVAVLAASRDLPGGAALVEADLHTVRMPPAAVPAGALRPGAAVLGRLVAGPVRRGEALTDVRLVGPDLLAALGGPAAGAEVVAVPVRIADAGSVALLRSGDHIDVLAAGIQPAAAQVPPAAGGTGTGTGGAGGPAPAGSDLRAGSTVVVAADVPVLSVPVEGRESALSEGALVVLATTPRVAAQLAAAAVSARLSITLRGH